MNQGKTHICTGVNREAQIVTRNSKSVSWKQHKESWRAKLIVCENIEACGTRGDRQTVEAIGTEEAFDAAEVVIGPIFAVEYENALLKKQEDTRQARNQIWDNKNDADRWEMICQVSGVWPNGIRVQVCLIWSAVCNNAETKKLLNKNMRRWKITYDLVGNADWKHCLRTTCIATWI